jgi:hypothetical protein
MKTTFVYKIASILTFLVGSIHFLTHFSSELTGTTEPQKEIVLSMKTIPFEMPGGNTRTMEEIMTGYGLTWAVLLILMGVIGFFVNASRRLHLLLGVANLLAAMVMFKYLIVPPSAMLLVASMLFVLSGFKGSFDPKL